MLVNLSISDYATRLASSAPAPGGGSAAALSGLIGASLLEMVIQLTIEQSEVGMNTQLLKQKQKELVVLHENLKGLVDRDAAAYSAVVKAYKLPEGSKGAKITKVSAIQEAVTRATQVPLEIARLSLEIMEIAKVLLGKVNAHVVSDLAIGAISSHTSVVGALLNTAINLPLLEDPHMVKAFEGQVHLLRSIADALLVDIESQVYREEPFTLFSKEMALVAKDTPEV